MINVPQMKRKLSRYIIAAFFINIFAIMSVGGVCILMVRDMVTNISRLEEESGKISILDDINSQTHKMVIAIHHGLIHRDGSHLGQALRIIEGVKADFAEYVRLYGDSLPTGEDDTDASFSRIISTNLLMTQKIVEAMARNFLPDDAANSNALQKLEEHASIIQTLTDTVNKTHFKTIASLVSDSYTRMYFILFLYLTSSFVGILASCVGYIVLTRHTITPIKKLASATQEVARGNFSTRVATSSSTEIGTLYSSFNIMAERLQEHERRREDLSRQLEKMVRERTFELSRANESLRKAHQDLLRMEKIATLGQIATSVNHEIKTPLNSLYMNLQLLTKQIKRQLGNDETSQQRMLELAGIIEAEISRINGILEEFVKYARFAPPELKKTEVNRLLRDVAETISQNAERAGVKIKCDLEDDVGEIMLDPKKMTQALLNLCVNAIQAMPDGGTLNLTSARSPREVIIAVEDNGTGIPPDHLEKIFDPFFTRKEGGLGFGLPIVQRIIEDHRGQITCTSRVNEYTRFEIALPVLYLA